MSVYYHIYVKNINLIINVVSLKAHVDGNIFIHEGFIYITLKHAVGLMQFW